MLRMSVSTLLLFIYLFLMMMQDVETNTVSCSNTHLQLMTSLWFSPIQLDAVNGNDFRTWAECVVSQGRVVVLVLGAS